MGSPGSAPPPPPFLPFPVPRGSSPAEGPMSTSPRTGRASLPCGAVPAARASSIGSCWHPQHSLLVRPGDAASIGPWRRIALATERITQAWWPPGLTKGSPKPTQMRPSARCCAQLTASGCGQQAPGHHAPAGRTGGPCKAPCVFDADSAAPLLQKAWNERSCSPRGVSRL